MSVEFDEPPAMVSVRNQKQSSSFSRLVIKTGIVKTETGAQIVLLVLAVALLLGSAFFFIRLNTEAPAPTPAQVVL